MTAVITAAGLQTAAAQAPAAVYTIVALST